MMLSCTKNFTLSCYHSKVVEYTYENISFIKAMDEIQIEIVRKSRKFYGCIIISDIKREHCRCHP